MRGEQFRARDKKVQKLTRDGLVEQNKSTGEEHLVSQRTADISFGPDRTKEQAAGRPAAKRRPARRPPPEAEEAEQVAEIRDTRGGVGQPPVKKRRQRRPEAYQESEKDPSAVDDDAPPEGAPGPQAELDADAISRPGRLHFEEDGDGQDVQPTHEKTRRKQRPPDAARTEQGRLRFEDDAPSEDVPEGTLDARRQRKYEKAARRVEQAGHKLERAQAKLPQQRRVRLEREYNSAAGKVRRRLHFESEIVPEGTKPSLPKRAGGAAVRGAKTTVLLKAHQKIREVERDNVGVEAAHKGEFLAERGAGRLLRWNKRRLRTKPYRQVRQANRRLAQEKANLAWQKALRDNPELARQHSLNKWFQKRQLKKKYAAAAREAKQTAHHTRNVLNATGQIARSVAQVASAHKTMLGLVAGLALVIILFSSGLSSCTAMLSGAQSSFLATTYMANEADINNSDLYYTELETDLQIDIDQTEQNYPGYDGYRYNIGEISHDPYELMGYLSAAFDAFTFEQVQSELDSLFAEQYTLTREAVKEDSGDEVRYILVTTLTVRPLSEIIAERLEPGEQTDRYGVYMQTYGNRQAFGNPFDTSWLGMVTSGYGYRVHPITGEKNLHRGVDLAAAEGTPIKAIQDGRVVSAGEAGSYGLCVVIEDENGYQSRYAHCSSLSVTTGQEVKRGDVIATVGSIGQSTGPHIHLEVMLNDEYLNPYYFVDNGGDGGALPGTPGGPVIPGNPGAAMGDGTFAAMLAEAEKYLGWPYVWGGSSPSTSFDCSGFVSWVINQSGAGSVGRQTAQGLYNLCTPVSRSDAQPGDLIFFTKTYSAATPVTHVGIYVGNGQMIHCGDPISYANINSNYWTSHFYGFGRLP